MELQIKRIYDAPSPDDGKRIFVDRLWARGLTKEKAQVDAWEKELAPSTELRRPHKSVILVDFAPLLHTQICALYFPPTTSMAASTGQE